LLGLSWEVRNVKISWVKITEEQVQTLFGKNLKYMSGTLSLTGLGENIKTIENAFAELENVGEGITITSCAYMTAIRLPNLQTVTGSIVVKTNGVVGEIYFKGLNETGNILIDTEPTLERVRLPKLSLVGEVVLTNLLALKALAMPELKSADRVYFSNTPLLEDLCDFGLTLLGVQPDQVDFSEVDGFLKIGNTSFLAAGGIVDPEECNTVVGSPSNRTRSSECGTGPQASLVVLIVSVCVALCIGAGGGYFAARRSISPDREDLDGGSTVISDGPTLADMREAARGEQEKRMQDNFIPPQGEAGRGPNDILF
jgi:hypothetical protein